MSQGLIELYKHRQAQFVQGRASFLDSRTLRIEQDAGDRTLSFHRAILATGSKPVKVPSLLLNSPRAFDSTKTLELHDIPQDILVIGGGYIGPELGTVYSALGSEVSVVEMTAGLLPGVDRDLVVVLSRRMKNQLHTMMLNTKVIDMKEEVNGIRVRFEGEGRQEPEQVFEKILIAVGRKPNTDRLGLENTAVEVDERGFVRVDAQRRTTDAAIYAIGDVAGEPMLAHKTTREGRVAAEAIAGHETVFEPRAMPAVVFTDPEIAWCGLTEMQAQGENRAIEICRFPWGASGRPLRDVMMDSPNFSLIRKPNRCSALALSAPVSAN